MSQALTIAKYIINKCTVDSHPISNLQLQKILYYVQKEFLSQGTQAFQDDMEAWQFGPVAPAVYRQYCGFGAMPIRMKYDVQIDAEEKKVIDPIVEEKRELDPWEMVKDTHQEGKAWSLTYNNGSGDHRVIKKELIRCKD